MKLILASASPRRAEILRDAGIPFTVLSSAVDETPLPGETAADIVRRLAAAKAELVAARAVGPAIVIAADTVVALDGTVMEKLSGRTHSVITGVSLIRLPDVERREFTDITQVHFTALSDEDIVKYLASGEPFDKAGAYAIQGVAGRFIPRIDGCYFNVVGLPLARLCRELSTLGWTEEQN
jgi:septum formation protein